MRREELGHLLIELAEMIFQHGQFVERQRHQPSIDWVERGAGAEGIYQLFRRRSKAFDRFTVLRQTMRQRWQAKLREVRTELRRRLCRPIPEQGAYLRSVLLGHVRYYGVPRNGPSLMAFRTALGRVWRTVLRRRSQTARVTWARLLRFTARWLPIPHICHPYPNQRLASLTQGGSRMR